MPTTRKIPCTIASHMADVSQSIPLPDNPLTWTSIAYVLWDEVDPQAVHAGARAGARRLASLGRPANHQRPGFARLAQRLFLGTVPSGHQRRADAPSRPTIRRSPSSTMVGRFRRARCRRTAAADGAVVGDQARHPSRRRKQLPNTGELMAERRVGRGRIVVSAMQLAERDLVNWRSGFESLFNACLLRRPPREYRTGFFGDVTLAWADRCAGRPPARCAADHEPAILRPRSGRRDRLSP